VDSGGRTIWIAEVHRGDGRRFVARAEEKLAAFSNSNEPPRIIRFPKYHMIRHNSPHAAFCALSPRNSKN